jgi:hypothetical protein
MDDPLTICDHCLGPEGLMRPSVVRFDDASSFTFVTRRAIGDHGTRFEVQWRLAEGTLPDSTATLDSGTLNLTWDDLDAPCA